MSVGDRVPGFLTLAQGAWGLALQTPGADGPLLLWPQALSPIDHVLFNSGFRVCLMVRKWPSHIFSCLFVFET